jgi:outer membrane autotransporter protein
LALLVTFLASAVIAVVFTNASLVPIAYAQTIVSVMTDAAGNTTARDSNGNTYQFNLSNVKAGSQPSTVVVTVASPNGTSQTGSLIVQNLRGTLFTVNGTIPNFGALSCTVHAATEQVVTGNCGPIFAAPTGAAATNFATSGPASALGAARSQTITVTSLVSERIRSFSRDLARGLAQTSSEASVGSKYRGVAAGSPEALWGVWGDASGSFLRNDTSVGYNGTSVVALAGADYILNREWLLGFSAGYTRADLDLRSVTANRTSNGAVFGPYVSYIISPNFSADAQFEYTRLSNNLSAPAPTPSGSFDSNRYTGAVNLNGYADDGPWKLTGYAGYTYTWEGSSTTLLSTIAPFSNIVRFGALKLGGEAGYVIDQYEAYVPLTYYYETTTPRDMTSRSALILGVGLRYQASDVLKAGIQATATEIKSHTQDVRIEGNLRWSF